jgi:hypothetical protein
MMQRLLLLAMLMPVFVNAQNRPTIPADLTLRQALDIALTNSSTLREAQGNLLRHPDNMSSRVLLYCLSSTWLRAGLYDAEPSRVRDRSCRRSTLLGPFGSMDAA